jgi:hypothetical protein
MTRDDELGMAWWNALNEQEREMVTLGRQYWPRGRRMGSFQARGPVMTSPPAKRSANALQPADAMLQSAAE